MGGGGAILGVAVLVIGAAIDFPFIEPFFLSMTAAAPMTGVDPLTTFLLLYGVPYATSCAIAAAIIGAVIGAAGG